MYIPVFHIVWVHLFVNKTSRHACESEMFNQVYIFEVIIRPIPRQLLRLIVDNTLCMILGQV